MRQILVTSALPYANGSIHLGHLVEYIQTDIWVRAMRALGNKVTYVCADDAHGTAIMLKAEELGLTPEEQIALVKAEHEADFAKFGIGFDQYHSTHSEENRRLSAQVYEKNASAGNIARRSIEQLFDPQKGLFLADRFVKGTCPKCDMPEQYGDNCENCGATYSATELKDARSTLSGAAPVLKSSEHYFFDLPRFEAFLKDWMSGDGVLQDSIKNKLAEWFESGLKQWDISRDAPYFGFLIPGTTDKYFYVWLDAPVGYMASFEALCARRDDLNFDDYWSKDAANQTELYHFIGKDIVNFHALFWPAMLEGADLRTPSGVFAHGFLTVGGEKMSKSRGTFIKAATFAESLKPEALRYYFASKLTASVEDINLDLPDFMQKVNSDLVGKVVNIASRCAGFITKQFDSKTHSDVLDPELLARVVEAGVDIAASYESREFAKAMRQIMACADLANEFIDAEKPWQLIKDDATRERAHLVCSQGINLFRLLVTYLAPVLPELAAQASEFLQTPVDQFAGRERALLNHEIAEFKPLMTRIETAQLDAVVEASKDSAPAASVESSQPAKTVKKKTHASAAPSEIEFADFAKVELKAAVVLSAGLVEGADKLLALTLDVGEDKPRSVFSGIREAYPDPQTLVGLTVIAVTNLAPRKMRFGVSEAMILASGQGDQVRVAQVFGVPAGTAVS